MFIWKQHRCGLSDLVILLNLRFQSLSGQKSRENLAKTSTTLEEVESATLFFKNSPPVHNIAASLPQLRISKKATRVCDHCGQRSSETPPLTKATYPQHCYATIARPPRLFVPNNIHFHSPWSVAAQTRAPPDCLPLCAVSQTLRGKRCQVHTVHSDWCCHTCPLSGGDHVNHYLEEGGRGVGGDGEGGGEGGTWQTYIKTFLQTI